MLRDKSLSKEIANKVFDLLIEEAGAYEGNRNEFLFAQTRKPDEYYKFGGCTEFRFGGKLGFGGKFWNTNNRFCVSAYSEETGSIQAEIIEKVNNLLKPIYEEHIKNKTQFK